MIIRVVVVEVVDDGFNFLRVIRIGILNVSLRSEGAVSGRRPVRPSETRVDASWGECIEDAELLGNLEWTVVIEQYRTGPKSNRVRFRGEGPKQHFRRYPRDSVGHTVVFSHPESLVSELLGLLGCLDGVRERVTRRPTGWNGGQVDGREIHTRIR
jgi:hypothetical protein